MIRQIVKGPVSFGAVPFGERAVDPPDAILPPHRRRQAPGRLHWRSRTVNQSRRPLVAATRIAPLAPIPNPHPLPALEEIWNQS